MGAQAQFSGPNHCIVSFDAAFGRWVQGQEVIGVPAREVFPDHAESQRLMDQVYRTGIPATLRIPSDGGTPGEVVIEPRYERGVIVGVTTEWRAVSVIPLSPAEASDLRVWRHLMDLGGAPALRQRPAVRKAPAAPAASPGVPSPEA